MKRSHPVSVTTDIALACSTALCTGQIAQNDGTPPATPPGKPTVTRGSRTVRRAVILALLVILLILWVAAEPIEAWWIERSTATSWMLWWSPLTSPPESSAVHVSLTLPTDRRHKIGEAFTLEVGLGTYASSADDTILTIHAPGFDITDKSGTTVPDTYTRAISDFGCDRYGMVSTQNRLERVWEIERFDLCGYLEDFTLTWRGEVPDTTSTAYSISASLRSSIGSADTRVYYTATPSRIRLTADRPSTGCASGHTELTPTETT